MKTTHLIHRELQLTADGSHTLFVPEMNEHYHSVNGACQESEHIFIRAGLQEVPKKEIQLLEIGFGTGLNALLTLKAIEEAACQRIVYHTIELYPLPPETIKALNYGDRIWPERKDLFFALHEAAWNKEVRISNWFVLHKIQGDCRLCTFPSNIDLIYFDAFAPEKQPEMWTQAMYEKLYQCAAEGAVLTTYCAKGEVRRGMQAAGFEMERLPGPPGKRHILRGRKRITSVPGLQSPATPCLP
ncbi:SAM-dependent methyltransferase [Parabacteroides sp. An277]|uniref:tRNA (5-methylaminomethyl-2-thiouridine)(34)-methyltransferase MnmD n=1 Tax=Parabacteroides sp. An277 TaxID=1965619 RepID=UPI000B398A27|nr:tRNA (5-methylaminomethyl-2-thiouridine)(34)-methyltransferase MnmD [Parabacteroides sp. An277]OUO51962.1 SAM-dependent methyltransferase [Parabacteroides sp. An277]